MDIKRHSAIYDELLKLNITLNFQDTPTPAYIQEKIIECNQFQVKTERFFIEVTRDLATAERMFKTDKLDFEMLKRSTLINNEKIKKIPTGKEREAAVDEFLESNHKSLLKLENDVNDLQSILSAIKQKQATLKSTNADIKSLAKLMEQQINRLNIGHPDDPDVKELAATFSEIDKLEEEIELEDVESSVEIAQPDDSENSEDLLEDSDVSVEFDTDGAVEELVDSTKLSVLEKSDVPGDKLDLESQKTAIKSEDGQGTNGVVEKSSKVTPVIEEVQNSDVNGDIEDELASFLTEDDSEAIQSEDDVREGEEVNSEEVTTEGADVAAVGNSEESPDISIEDDLESDIESHVTVSPKVDVDLSDIGIDLDLGETEVPTPPKKVEAPATNNIKPTNEKAPVQTDVSKKIDPPKQKAETKSTNTSDIDLLDILSSLDE